MAASPFIDLMRTEEHSMAVSANWKKTAGIFVLLAVFSSMSVLAGGDKGLSAGQSAIKIHRNGSQSSVKAPDEHFSGQVRIDPLFAAEGPSNVSAGLVTFEPGARSAWHTHPVGQVLIVISGKGLVQEWGGPMQEINPGDVVRIPPGVKHWHGATAKTAMAHIAIQEQENGRNVDWLEKVSDAQYRQ
jgi:4-carboxymuconolactone decarboxylase